LLSVLSMPVKVTPVTWPWVVVAPTVATLRV
jgi:hypothetical protein